MDYAYKRMNAKVSDGVLLFIAEEADGNLVQGNFPLSQVEALYDNKEVNWNDWKNHAIMAKFLNQYFGCPILLKLNNSFSPKYVQIGDYDGKQVVPNPT